VSPRRTRALAVAVTGTILVTLGVGSAQAAPKPPHFIVPTDASSGGTLPQQLATGDFNNDGQTDVASANQGPIPLFGSSIGVVLGDGNGGISAPVTTDLPDGTGACDIAAGNFDGAGGTDVAVLSCTTGGASKIDVLIADGDGSFTLTQQFANTADGQLASADFNGDGTDDLAFSQRGTAQVQIFIGRGNGRFKAPVIMATDFDSYDLMTGFVNGDGAPDLVGAAGGPVWTMLNDGHGHFAPQVYDFSADLSGIELAVGQFNGDGNLDVAVVDASGGHVYVGLGQGNGHFTPGTPIGPIGPQTNWVAAGDVTGDGVTDLVGDLDSNSSMVLIGNGTGTFPKRSSWVTGSEGLTVVDLDGAGPLDLVTFSSDPGIVHATVATAAGLLAPRLRHGAYPQVAADLNNDGALDKVTGGTGVVRPGVIRSDILAQLNKGTGVFGKQVVSKVRLETAASGIGAIGVADINEDGIPDVVGGFENFQPSPNNLFWMIGKGNGAFGKPTLSTTGDPNADVVSLGLGDVNADGHVDIVSHTLSALSTRLGRGNGTFRPPIVSGFSGASQEATLVADFTGDGVLDTVAVRRTGTEDISSGEIYLERGLGNGTFTRIQTRTVDSNLSQADMADLNGDGRPDVVTPGSAGFDAGRNAMWILLTTPQGQLGVPVPYQGPSGGQAIADYNGDGAPDIAVNAINAFTIYVNAGNGTFPTTSDILAGGGVAVAADFTGDGAPDIGGRSGVMGTSFALYVNAG
jgi:FG-GAP-like repeat